MNSATPSRCEGSAPGLKLRNLYAYAPIGYERRGRPPEASVSFWLRRTIFGGQFLTPMARSGIGNPALAIRHWQSGIGNPALAIRHWRSGTFNPKIPSRRCFPRLHFREDRGQPSVWRLTSYIGFAAQPDHFDPLTP
ncbi:hypothetical protein [Sphingomonas glacialis]|uniref:hypothetical protein n=1 Tax=Sphingomonas glacialis TaxID=658225 RepID=UPI00112953C9|nr:hypothetical protein [Sphingomonas glacialis]